MKLLSVLAILFFGLAYAQPRSGHQLKHPQFQPGKTHYYDVAINVTSGVPGMSSQVAKTVILTELKIYPKTQKDLIIQIQRARLGESSPGVESPSGDVKLRENSSLEQDLRVPCSVVYEHGKVKSYSVSPTESLLSRKIRRSILRSFEFHLDEKLLRRSELGALPIIYNVTQDSAGGNYESHYIVTSSPYYEFPYEKNVYNITRFDNYEAIPYIAYKTHHNYERQGCSDVCSALENGAGCPPGHEPHHSPIKRSFVQRHNLVTLGSSLIIDSINTKETHLTDVYDQNIELTIETEVKFRKASRETILDPPDQKILSDLDDITQDIDEEEIEHMCQYPDSSSSLSRAQGLLDEVAETMLKNELQGEQSKRMGELLVILQKLLQRLRQEDLRLLKESLMSHSGIKQSSDKEKIKRQIWLDLLPVIGTSESVSFIVSYISGSINNSWKDISVWESKSILDSLPSNIHRPDHKTINKLNMLLSSLKKKEIPHDLGHMLFASIHFAVAKVINSLCSWPKEQSGGSSPSWKRWLHPKKHEDDDPSNPFQYNMQRKCPKTLAREFIDDVTRELKRTDNKARRIIYMEALSRTGVEAVLPTLREYMYGQAIFRDLSRRDIDFLRTAAIYSLHSLAHKSPRAVQDLLVPVFFNSTEPPKLRTAAFSVILHTKPTMSLLELVAYNSWQEPSEEVGSYVTSSLESFGNSSMPCHLITTQLIKKVLPQVKHVSIGEHKAKNIFYDYWNDIGRIGLLKHLDYMPSNESIIPSALYGYSGYTTDSMTDNYLKFSLLNQGLSAHKISDSILQMLGLPSAENIPLKSESKIFSEMNIAARNTEPWRLLASHKLFYSTSFYYFNEEEVKSSGQWITMLQEVLDHYISRDSEGRYSGHFTKLFIPGSFHTKTIAQSLPYPLQFEKKNPILLSLKIETEKTISGHKWHITPSVYSSIIHGSEILSLADCKRVGVYHNHRTIATYPITLNLQKESSGRFSLGYRFPELPKTIISHSSEAGTYAGMDYFQPFPTSTQDKRTIKTIPSQFVNSFSWNIFGLPVMNGVCKTEDIEHRLYPIPRTWRETCEYVSRQFLNAGWRRRSLEIARETDSKTWTAPDTEVTFKVQYSKDFISLGEKSRSSESDWSRDLDFEDKLDKQDPTSYATEGRRIYQKFTSSLSHCRHSLKMEAEQLSTRSSSAQKMADLNLEYFHTLEGSLHLLHFNTTCWKPSRPIEVTGDYAVGFTGRPDEYKYDEGYGEQRGIAVGSLSLSKTTPFIEPFVVAKAVFKYKPLSQVLLNLDEPPSPREEQPDTHEQCLADKEEGNLQSPACIKAIREKSIYNNLRMHAVWTQEPPKCLREIGDKIDSALKYALFSHLNVSRRPEGGMSSRSFHLETTYIDKWTSQPVMDIVLEKPTEKLNFTRVRAGKMRPMSSIESIAESYAAFLTNNTFPATCSLTGNYVKTYDMKTYHMPRSTPACNYVLSTHCTRRKKFSVLVKHDPNSSAGTREVKIFIGKDEIILEPTTSRSSYRIYYNHHYLTVTTEKPVILNEEAQITAAVYFFYRGNSLIVITARKAGVTVSYNGESVSVKVNPRYKGEVCGLCSEFNGEVARELRGVDGCLYMDEEDFAKSSIVGECGDKRPKHRVLCNDEDISLWASSSEESSKERDEPTMKRNIVISNGMELCFSIKPVPVCEGSARPTETESQQVDFHCLPKQDVHARKMVTESKRRILGELETKAIDFSESVEVAKMC